MWKRKLREPVWLTPVKQLGNVIRRMSISSEITEPGHGDPIINSSSSRGHWQAIYLVVWWQGRESNPGKLSRLLALEMGCNLRPGVRKTHDPGIGLQGQRLICRKTGVMLSELSWSKSWPGGAEVRWLLVWGSCSGWRQMCLTPGFC